MPFRRSFARRWALLLAVFAAAADAAAASATEPADTAARRRDSLQGVLSRSTAKVVASLRKGCVRGITVAGHQEDLARGEYWAPDAVDECVTILTRHGRDGTLDAIYRTILLDLVKDDTGANTLAAEIGSYVFDKHITDVPLARAVSLPVTAALAVDAGFTNGYRDTSKPKDAVDKLPSEAALKPLVERCLALTEGNVTGCYSAGYVYGLRAARGELVAAAR